MAYHLTLPLARHERLRDFRGLVLGTHPLIPIGSAVRAGLNRVAVALVDGGAPRRMAQSTAAEAAVLYTKFLFSG